MALEQELEIQWLLLENAYRSKGAITTFQVGFQNKPWTLLNSAFLEDGSPKPNPTKEDRHIEPITDYDNFMKAEGNNIIEKAYNALKNLPEFTNSKDA